MLAQLRKVDAPGRIGGEEFAVLLPGVGPEEAMKSAERLRLAIATNPIILSDGTRIDQTISIGITSILSTDLDTKTPLARADKALYQAKNQGRNQSVIA
jgi:diguanylate cyclase (GGDEF)-like protein